MRDVAGSEELEDEIAQGDTVAVFLEGLMGRLPGLRTWETKILVAVDRSYAERDAILRDGQEVTVMPLVQGGRAR